MSKPAGRSSTLLYGFPLALLASFLTLFSGYVYAQNEGSVYLSPPRTINFPQIETSLIVIDSSGEFVYSLSAKEIELLEDGILLPVNSAQLLRPGIQAVIAINPGPTFAIQNNQGVSRYDFILEAIKGWAAHRTGSTIDDLSHLTTAGTSISHFNRPKEFAETLTEDIIDARTAVPNLDTLSRAVDLVLDPTPRSGMGRAVLFVTAPMQDIKTNVIESIISKANNSNTHISIWMIASQSSISPEMEGQFKELAERTGGFYWLYSAEDQFPDIDGYFEPHRNIYQLKYDSRLNTSGVHHLIARIKSPLGLFTSQTQSFELDIQPPQPVFITPPVRILRTPFKENKFASNGEENLVQFTPDEQTFFAIFDYPDGHPRSIVRSALFIDGVLIDENKAPPFDEFIWNIENYLQDSTHQIQIEAQDQLGLIGRSVELPIEIRIEKPQTQPGIFSDQEFSLLSLTAITLAGTLLLLIHVTLKRIRPFYFALISQKKAANELHIHSSEIKENLTSQKVQFWSNRLLEIDAITRSNAEAFLEREFEDNEEDSILPVPLCLEEILIGSDAELADLVLNDPSVEGLHARLWRDREGCYFIKDNHSVAGTWINFQLVSNDGDSLKHGDVVNLGRTSFRFKLQNPSDVPKPVIQYLDRSDF